MSIFPTKILLATDGSEEATWQPPPLRDSRRGQDPSCTFSPLVPSIHTMSYPIILSALRR